MWCSLTTTVWLMEKTRDKQLEDRGQAIRQPDDANERVKKMKVSKVETPNTLPPALVPLCDPSQALVSAPHPTGSRDAVRGKEEVKDQSDAPVPLSDPYQALISAPDPTGSRSAVRGKEEVKDQSDLPVPLSDPCQALISAPDPTGSRAAVRGKEEAKGQSDRLSGYIFKCNGKTKPECFGYRAFGLPPRKKEVLEKINKDMKLFLYDFDQRLLYGIYKAECRGQLNLEPNAFGGKFQAQVRFAIDKDCLPLPETAFKGAIKDNYEALFRFKPELSGCQVKDLLSLFLPRIESTTASVAPMPVVAPPRAILLSPQYQYYGMQHGCAGPMIDPCSMQRRVPNSHRELFGTEATMERDYPTLNHQGLPAPNDPYYFQQNQMIYGAWEGEYDQHQNNVVGCYQYPTAALPQVPQPMHPNATVCGRPEWPATNFPGSSY